jgi:urocanate hydratase
MGGAQPLAGRMAGAAILCVDIDPVRAKSARRSAISKTSRRISIRRWR